MKHRLPNPSASYQNSTNAYTHSNTNMFAQLSIVFAFVATVSAHTQLQASYQCQAHGKTLDSGVVYSMPSIDNTCASMKVWCDSPSHFAYCCGDDCADMLPTAETHEAVACVLPSSFGANVAEGSCQAGAVLLPGQTCSVTCASGFAGKGSSTVTCNAIGQLETSNLVCSAKSDAKLNPRKVHSRR
jgi:hypothetical protein